MIFFDLKFLSKKSFDLDHKKSSFVWSSNVFFGSTPACTNKYFSDENDNSKFYCEKNVVNIGSIYGSVVPNAKLYKNFHKESSIQYGVTKSALEHLTKELSVRLAKKFVRVNCAAFGGVEGRVNQSFKKRYAHTNSWKWRS